MNFTFGDSLVDLSDSDSLVRLIDATFANICLATSLLASMTKVSSEFLHQKFAKKIMSISRCKKILHERYTELLRQSGTWSSDQKWPDDAPEEQVNSATASLMASGARAAIVHCL